jgi:alkylation response protein AidB-like acyl-CoA dehydrogenase
MNFDFSEEQNMLKDSVARFVQDNYSAQRRREIVASEQAFDKKNWASFAELGWLSIPFDEAVGGFGGNAVDTMVVMEQLGKGLVVEPYLATVLLFGGLIQRSGSPAQQEDWLPRIIAGEVQGAFAFHERQSRFELTDIATTASVSGDQIVLNGEKTVVANGMAADAMVVSARTSGAETDEDGISLLLVDSSAPGMERTGYRLMDGQLVADVRFDNVVLGSDAVLGELDTAYPAIRAVVDDATVALCSEALGIMEKLNSATVEYTKTREQFGVAIGSFQALQHRMVDTFMAYEQTRSLVYRAVCSADDEGVEGQRNRHALKVMVDRAGKLVGDEALQIHGGIGQTDELDIGHYVKRLMTLRTQFGNGDYHQNLFNQISYG